MGDIPEGVTPELLRRRFIYNPLTGGFIWRPRARDDFPTQRAFAVWTARFAGKAAFISRTPDGYATAELYLNRTRHTVCGGRAAFAIMTGRFPSDEIDHINRVRDDDRFANLREATRAQNNQNVIKPGRYKTGTRRSGYRWTATIYLNARHTHLGTFDTEDEAHQAYLSAAVAARADFVPLVLRAA